MGLRSGIHPCQCGPELEAVDAPGSLTSKNGFVLTSHEGDAVKLYHEPFEVLFVKKNQELK